jgi:hypothetical protein
MSISIVNGRIFVLINNGGIRTILESNATNYNDGRWHYISVNKIDKEYISLATLYSECDAYFRFDNLFRTPLLVAIAAYSLI